MADPRSDLAELEVALSTLHPAWPATPDLASAVRSQLAPRSLRRRRLWAWLVGALASVGVATMAIEPARSAVFELLGVQTVRLERSPTNPSPRPFGERLDLGRPATLVDGLRMSGLRVTPPRSLGDPDGVWVRRPSRAVSLVYRRPTLLIQVVAATLDQPILGKVAGPGVRIEEVPGGYFLSGAPHGVGWLGPDGVPVVEQQRLAGNTLLVERGGALVRVEGRLGRMRALELAAETEATRAPP